MAAVDFNPGFSFDAGDFEAPAQAPWEFGGALKMALKDRQQPASTIDDKINKRLQDRQQKQQARKGAKAAGKKRAREESSEEAESEADDSDDDDYAAAGSSSDGDDAAADSSGESDQPLPGELDSDEDDAVLEDDDESEEADEPAAGRIKGQQQQQQASKSAAATAAARRAAAAAAASEAASPVNGTAAAGSSSEDDEDQEDSEEQPGSSSVGDDEDEEQQQQQHKQRQRPDKHAAANGKAGDKAKAGFYAETQRGFKKEGVSFQDLNLSRPLLRAVAALGYTHPTPIQAACIPLALAGRDICGSAMTGSGKTAAFALPILERLLYRPRQVAATYVLMLAPTRELAAQIHSMVQRLAQFTDVDAALIVGGLSLTAQAAALRAGPCVVVATPGRVIDHVRNSQGFGLEDLSVLVLDEADRLLEMGFKEELREILRMAPKQRQTLLFSATFNDDVAGLVALSLKQPVRLAADAAAAAPSTLSQEIVRLKGSAASEKEAALLALASRSFSNGRTIVFCKTKQRAHRLKLLFGLCKLPPAAELHGDMTQAARLESLERFRRGEAAYLLATDVAARGLDILGVQVVLNFDAPRSLETYLHRIGRTARAGESGVAVSLIGDEDRALLKEVVKKGRVTLKQRVVPPQAMAKWQGTIEAAEPDVERVLSEEHEEAALRRAEMEANKAANMLEHEDEIYSRPARTWFQTEKQKKEAAAAAAAAAEGRTVLEDAAAAATPAGKAASKAAKSAAKQDKKNARIKEQRAAEAAAGGKKRAVPALQSETEAFSKAIRGVKSRARALMQQQGMSAKAAQKIAAKAVTGVSTTREKKKRKTGTGLFSGDGISKADEGGAAAGAAKGGSSSGGKGGKDGKARGNLSKSELSRVKRGGKGKSSFKSQKKFKRRK
ncbi:P-loop containing nucleoside triphosphate hydrolase protein [Scenedesmus sp. NREL 46B-D3]|nr:P-loop containing nucleoside triphosphate hydrolase protein [Scenedesmus sp. NREL 46B-D3]